MIHPGKAHRLFEVYGVEVEYMVVDRTTLEVTPKVDVALDALSALSPDGESRVGPIEWSNELVAHVAEAKCAQPVPDIAALRAPWNRAIVAMEAVLAPHGACLLPSSAHPWMNPRTDARLWPHEGREIYAEFDRIFGCSTHGWTNLQSMHLNLPFGDDAEFGRLHAAVRLVLPLIPALAAGSPYLDGAFTGWMDTRMETYRTNSAKIPSMTGPLIPEPIFTEDQYRRDVFERIYAETAPYDPDGILRNEWANSRGAIARFDRNAIEIRVIDSQECPQADLAVAQIVATLARLLTEGRFASTAAQQRWDTLRLRSLFFRAVRDAERAPLGDPEYATLFGAPRAATFGELWAHLLALSEFQKPELEPFLRRYLEQGCLARRLVARGGLHPERHALAENLRALRQCLADDSLL